MKGKKNPGNNIIHRENITSFTIFKKLKLVRERKKKSSHDFITIMTISKVVQFDIIST